MKLIAEGAEARVYAGPSSIAKKRLRKSYRIRQLDDRLRRFRTRREAKILERLRSLGADVPKVIRADPEKGTITLELIKGKKVRDSLGARNCEKLGRSMGEAAGLMHGSGIIHGDLTTSNMIESRGKLFLIDFGLGFFSDKTEYKAVDVHLLRQALRGTHSRVAEKCFEAFLQGYSKNCPGSGEVLDRLEKVESRGRYKGKTEKLR